MWIIFSILHIIYVPDFVANRMGIVNCANEAYGRVGALGGDNPLWYMDDPAVARHLERDWENAIFNITKTVIGKAR